MFRVGTRIEHFIRERDRAYGSRDDNDGNGGNLPTSSIPWTRRIDYMLALWSVCLVAGGRLTHNPSGDKQDDNDSDGNDLPWGVP